jgi:YbbR domain-containing protein
MWKFIFENFGFKIVALVMALLLWFHVATEKVYEYTKSFPVEILNVPKGLILSGEVPKEVRTKIRGKGKELVKLLLTEKRNVQIDLGNLKAGESDYTLKPEEIPIPEGSELKVEEILSPKNIKINLEHVMEKKIPIRSQIIVLPKDSYIQVGEVSLDLPQVVISGPAGLVKKIDTIYTEKKILKEVDRPITDEIGLTLPPGYNLKLSVKQVNFSVDVQKATEKEIPNVPVELVNLPRGRNVEVQPESIKVVILGGENVVNPLTKDQIKVTIDCAKLKRNVETKVQPLVKLPPTLSLIRIQPDSLGVTVH